MGMDYLVPEVWNITKSIISDDVRPYKIRGSREKGGYGLSTDFVTFDLMMYYNKKALKNIGILVGYERLQELPYLPGTILSEEQMDAVLAYNVNDVYLLRQVSLEKVNVGRFNAKVTLCTDPRLGINDIHKITETDRQLTERVLLMDDYDSFKPMLRKGVHYYQPPIDFEFDTPEFQRMYHEVLKAPLDPEPRSKNSAKVSKSTTDEDNLLSTGYFNNLPIEIKTGGMHWVNPGRHKNIVEGDWSAFYPNLMLKFDILPDILKRHKERFSTIIDMRIEAKANKDPIDGALKIVINTIYGAMGMYSYNSKVFDKYLMNVVCITGQLFILKYAELLHLAGYTVVYINTDGVMYTTPEHLQGSTKADEIKAYMEQLSRNKIDYTDFKDAIFRDVNNYIAIQDVVDSETGKTIEAPKYKGDYALGKFMNKYAHKRVSSEAIQEYVFHGKNIRDYIHECTDPSAFALTTNFNKSYSVWLEDTITGDIEPQNTAYYRWYVSKNSTKKLMSLNNNTGGNPGNRNGTDYGVQMMENLPSEVPLDVDYDYYEHEAYKMLEKFTGEVVESDYVIELLNELESPFAEYMDFYRNIESEVQVS